MIVALTTARLLFGKADLTMSLNGAIAGLVSITAEPLAPSPLLATVIGGIGGALVVELALGWWTDRAGSKNLVYGLIDLTVKADGDLHVVEQPR